MSKSNALRKGERCDSVWCAVRRSGIHGRGLFASKKIPAGTPIIEYTGEKIDKAESNERGWAQIDRAKASGDAAVYIFTLDDEYDIDGNVPGNAARLINHSCDPNCEAVVEEDDKGRPEKDKVYIEAIKDIAKGEELTYNYGIVLEERHTPKLKKLWGCRCGADNCTGTMLQPKRRR